MAKVKCRYCTAMINDNDEKCPNCGAPNLSFSRFTTDKERPRTIEEFRSWYEKKGLPPFENTRFFIGVDYKAPKAYGICKSGSDYVVYKNLADGQRVIRYKGTDEEYAVNELYLRLRDEIINQKRKQNG